MRSIGRLSSQRARISAPDGTTCGSNSGSGLQRAKQGCLPHMHSQPTGRALSRWARFCLRVCATVCISAKACSRAAVGLQHKVGVRD